jgi:glucose-6-phosphate 1-dehydrogenase
MLSKGCSPMLCAATRFFCVREDAVEASWAVVQQLLGNVFPAHVYEPGFWGPAEANSLAADIGAWHDLK